MKTYSFFTDIEKIGYVRIDYQEDQYKLPKNIKVRKPIYAKGEICQGIRRSGNGIKQWKTIKTGQEKDYWSFLWTSIEHHQKNRKDWENASNIGSREDHRRWIRTCMHAYNCLEDKL